MGIASLNSQPSALICSAIASLRIAHEDTSAKRWGCAWCEIQAAQRALEAAAAELHAQIMPPLEPEATGPNPFRPLCPPSPFLMPMPIPPVHPKAIVVQCAIRPELPPHQDYTSAKILADAQQTLTK